MKYVHTQYDIIRPTWKVLQVGGSEEPFRRANYVIDSKSYFERKKENSWVQTIPEFFSKETWIQQDLESGFWPFEDEEFDFVIVDQQITKFRDPIAICKEIERVGKRGYIEVPTITTEHIFGLESDGISGHADSRWICILEDNVLNFKYKHPAIHTNNSFHIKPPEGIKKPFISPRFSVNGFLWDGCINAVEDKETLTFPDWFYENNVSEHTNICSTITTKEMFWDPSGWMPVLFSNLLATPNSFTNIANFEPKFMIKIFGAGGERTNEIINFEKLIAKKYKQLSLF
jgi:hypothetical protein